MMLRERGPQIKKARIGWWGRWWDPIFDSQGGGGWKRSWWPTRRMAVDHITFRRGRERSARRERGWGRADV